MSTVVIGDRKYPTKKAAIEACRAVRDRYQPPPAADVTDPADIAFLHDLLDLHPEAEEKIGGGIDHFFVAHNQYGTVSFYLVRTDGSRDDFSFMSCVNR